jgi:DNA-3-methyladenine glycosylase
MVPPGAGVAGEAPGAADFGGSGAVDFAAGGAAGAALRALPVPLPRSFHARPAPEVAAVLLGTRLVSVTAEGPLMGTIVETEAYLGPADRASHARSGRTRRNRAMFGPPGYAYVYRVYGVHWCLNVVTGADGQAQAVLIRAVFPERGEDAVRVRRGRPDDPLWRLAAGPARVCRGFGIDGADDGRDLTTGERLWIGAPGTRDAATLAPEVVTGPRIGVAHAGEPWASLPYRFGVAGHPSLSRPFRDGPGGRPREGAA